MASQINPNNIDGSYPVAGQDNNSQGFRDNFTNTRTNFAFAAAEISDLQSKVVLKQPLTGTIVANNNMNGTRLIDAQFQDCSAAVVDLQTISGSVNIDYAAGHYHYNAQMSGNVTLDFLNFPTAVSGGNTPWGWLIFRIFVPNVAYTLNLGPKANLQSLRGIQGVSGTTITFAETGTYEFGFHSITGSTATNEIYVHELTRPRNRFTNPLFLVGLEEIASTDIIDLSTTTTYFATGASPETSNLTAGVEGQIKILIMSGDGGGDMTVDVENAGWKSTGNGDITFDDIGQTVTLMYVAGKWYSTGAGAGAGNTFAQFS